MWIKHTCPQNQFLPFQTIHHYEQDKGCQRTSGRKLLMCTRLEWATRNVVKRWQLLVQFFENWKNIKSLNLEFHGRSWVRMIIRHGRKHCSQIKPKSNFLTLTWPATFRGREMLSMTRGTLTIFVLRVREDQRERPLNRTMYYRFSDENLLPSARTVKVMDQSWQWPKTHKRLKMKHTKVIPRPGIACLYTSVL